MQTQVNMDIYSLLKKIVIIEFDFVNFYFVEFLVFEKFENHFLYFRDIVVMDILDFSHRFRVFIFKNLVEIIF